MKYQDILNEYFLIKKEVNPAYSLRAFARDLGLPSSNLSNVLKGKQGLSIKSALQILERLKIKGRDRELFFDLVLSQDARAKRDKAKGLLAIAVLSISSIKLKMRLAQNLTITRQHTKDA